MLRIALQIQPSNIDFSPVVANTIVNKLSFNMDTVETWNVDQAPNEQQMRNFIKTNKKSLLTKMTHEQRENLFKWMLKGELYDENK